MKTPYLPLSAFVTQVAAVVATGAFRDFGQAMDNWRNPGLRARVPRTKRQVNRHRLLSRRGQCQAGLHPAQRHLLRDQHQQGEPPRP